MSSRILRNEQAAAARPFDWIGQQAEASAAAVRLYGGSAPEFSRPAGEAGARRGESEIAARLEEAYCRGVRDGEAASAERSEERVAAKVRELAAAIERTADCRARLRRDAERDLVELSLAVARKLVRRQISVDPDALQGVVRAALEKMEAREIRRVRLHPSHATPARALLSGSVEVVADPALEPGALLFETARGTLDAGLDTQLAEIERGLTDLLPR